MRRKATPKFSQPRATGFTYINCLNESEFKYDRAATAARANTSTQKPLQLCLREETRLSYAYKHE